MFKAYIFGDKICHKSFQNDVIDAVILLFDTEEKSYQFCLADAENINIVWENVPGTDSPLKRLLLIRPLTGLGGNT